jgi:phage shock protein PspC (stress-responsive transcriptional regulator)
MKKKLTLGEESKSEFLGVCQGLSDYCEVDVALIRILTALLILSGGFFILYVIFYISMPRHPKDLK